MDFVAMVTLSSENEILYNKVVMNNYGSEIEKQLPSYGECKKAKIRWMVVSYAIRNKTGWQEVERKYGWTGMTRREFYFWKDVAIKHFAERVYSYESTKWYALRGNKKNIRIKPWFAFLDRKTTPNRKEITVKSELEFVYYSRQFKYYNWLEDSQNPESQGE